MPYSVPPPAPSAPPINAPLPAPLPPLTAAPPSAPTAAPPSAPIPASLATSMYLSLPSFGTPPAWLAACRLQALMSSRVGVAGGTGEGAGVWATTGGAGAAGGGVTTAVGAADGDSTRASWVGAGARLATTRPVTIAETAATATPMAVSFQMFARLDSFMCVTPPMSVESTYRASDSLHDLPR